MSPAPTRGAFFWAVHLARFIYFRFAMTDERAETKTEPDLPAGVEGPSFSNAMKALATLAMLALARAAWNMVAEGVWSTMDRSSQLVMGAAMLVIAAAYGGMLTGRTSIDGQRIRQTGLWTKEVRLAELTQVKLIAVPGLTWLIAPRLVVRAGGLAMTTFHIADSRVLAAVRRLAYG